MSKDEITEDGLVLDDGMEIKADAIVHATGYQVAGVLSSRRSSSEHDV
jgi:NADH dehydrogenase FAD-containing subunit